MINGSYYVIYYEKFKKFIQQTEKVDLSISHYLDIKICHWIIGVKCTTLVLSVSMWSIHFW